MNTTKARQHLDNAREMLNLMRNGITQSRGAGMSDPFTALMRTLEGMILSASSALSEADREMVERPEPEPTPTTPPTPGEGQTFLSGSDAWTLSQMAVALSNKRNPELRTMAFDLDAILSNAGQSRLSEPPPVPCSEPTPPPESPTRNPGKW